MIFVLEFLIVVVRYNGDIDFTSPAKTREMKIYVDIYLRVRMYTVGTARRVGTERLLNIIYDQGQELGRGFETGDSAL